MELLPIGPMKEVYPESIYRASEVQWSDCWLVTLDAQVSIDTWTWIYMVTVGQLELTRIRLTKQQ